ncbi:proline-rich protein 11 isoform X2 [Ambystoma mexicanum]|uniref:proline-rich protein 11 isoform X2 n=1 Tax=Ambystoma mexicanum TaxID=8296 RepID=UPI0037E82C1C
MQNKTTNQKEKGHKREIPNFQTEKSFDAVTDVLVPSRTYLRELSAVKQQVQKLEIELSWLQKAVKNGGTTISFENSSCPQCHKSSISNNEFLAISSNVLQPATPFPPMPPVLPTLLPQAPPPPPPPPPPPLPPPNLFMPKPVVVLKKVANTLKDAPLKKEGPVQVTLKDLMNVKLRKTSENVEKQKRSPKKERHPLVRLSDLQSLNLRPKTILPQTHVSLILLSPNKSQIDLRKHLKKVNLKRSPGGTPIYDRENKDTGTGLTPIMTRALKQKFQMALPRSPPPNRLPAASHFEEIQ